jgi:hypothetical protein
LSGFSSAGAGKLIGPDGQEMDTEDFLASLEVTSSGSLTSYWNFNVVTQKYGKGIVQYGSETKTNFYSNQQVQVVLTITSVMLTVVIYLAVDTSVVAGIGSN